jgi:hypothetical protein
LPLATTLPFGVRTFLGGSPRRDRPADSSASSRVTLVGDVDHYHPELAMLSTLSLLLGVLAFAGFAARHRRELGR